MSNIVYLEKTDVAATLTTWIWCSYWQMYAAEKLGLICYINWPRDRRRALAHYYDDQKFDEVQNMHDWYFEQPHHEIAPPKEKVWTWEDKAEDNPEMAKAQSDHQLYGDVPTIKAFYKKHLKLNATVNARGEALVKKYGIDFSKTIGITWRGTDSIIDGRPRMPIETYFPFIDDILKEHPDYRIMCTAEEDILGPLLARYPTAFKIGEFAVSPPGHRSLGSNPEHFSSLSGFEKGMQPALMVYLFSKCAYYIKNRASTAAVASWLSDGKIVSLAHPENMGHGFDITKAEIEGRIYDLKR